MAAMVAQLARAAEGLFTDAAADGLCPHEAHAKHVLARQDEALVAALRGHVRPAAAGPLALVYDVEGTTTPLPFVTRVLFPYSEEHLEAWVAANITVDVLERAGGRQAGDNNGVTTPAGARGKRDREGVPADDELVTIAEGALASAAAKNNGVMKLEAADKRAAIVAEMRAAIAANAKVPFLKLAQGRIWRHGYEGGALRGRLFDDAAVAIAQLGRPGGVFGPTRVTQHIYSSGSVAAQRLLFRHSSHGDLSPFIAGYNDPTAVGPKVEAASYDALQRRVAGTTLASEAVGPGSPTAPGSPRYAPDGATKLPRAEATQLKGFVFVTDSLAELKAALQCDGGVLGILCVRPLNAPLPSTDAAFTEALGGEDAARRVVSITSFEQLVRALSTVLLQQGDAAVRCGMLRGEVADLALPAAAQLKAFN